MKKLTKITENNIAWFLPLLPEEGLGHGEFACGVIGDDGAACAAIVLRPEGDVTLRLDFDTGIILGAGERRGAQQ